MGVAEEPIGFLLLLTGNVLKSGRSRTNLSSQENLKLSSLDSSSLASQRTTSHSLLLAVQDTLDRYRQQSPAVQRHVIENMSQIPLSTGEENDSPPPSPPRWCKSMNAVVLFDHTCLEKIRKEERNQMFVTVKLWLPFNAQSAGTILDQALQTLEKYHQLSIIENLIIGWVDPSTGLQVSQLSSTDFERQFSSMLPLLSELVKQKKIQSLGLSESTIDVLKMAQEWTRNKDISISINQVTEAFLRNQGQALIAFAEQHHIQLISNPDQGRIVPVEELHQSMQDYGLETSFSEIPNLRLQWLVKYNCNDKCRGVALSKGFLVTLTRCTL